MIDKKQGEKTRTIRVKFLTTPKPEPKVVMVTVKGDARFFRACAAISNRQDRNRN
jgi:hypothetical protein